MNEQEKKTALFANLIEIGKRALLKNTSEDFQVPDDAIPAGVSRAQWVADQFAAALENAMRDQAISQGVV